MMWDVLDKIASACSVLVMCIAILSIITGWPVMKILNIFGACFAPIFGLPGLSSMILQEIRDAKDATLEGILTSLSAPTAPTAPTALTHQTQLHSLSESKVMWMCPLPQDIVRKIASMSDASVRAVCQTMREGFDEAFGSSSSDTSVVTPRRDRRAYLLAAGVCRMAKELNGQIKIKLHHPTVTKNNLEVTHCIAPSDLYDLFIDEILEATPKRRFEVHISCGACDDDTADATAKAVALKRACGCVRRGQSLTRVRWWKEGYFNLSMHMMSNVTYRSLVNFDI